jgi:hypothetical protein
MSSSERREFQRLHLDPPVPGTLGTTAVSILELGVIGARVHHAQPFDEQQAELRFSFDNEEIGLRCELVRTTTGENSKYPDSGYESGLRFVAAIEGSGDVLRRMLATLVTKELEQRPPLNPLHAGQAIDGDKTVRGTQARYVCYRLETNDTWTRRPVFLPEQPSAGFTVTRDVDHDEMERLCLVYLVSDDEGRRLIRLFAELSISEELEIPPRS